jgi:hydrogenase nickel incorporation protein HypA/HybF
MDDQGAHDAVARGRMHELSIAMSLVDLAAEEAERRGASRVNALHLRLGPLSGVVGDALRFSFDIAAEGTSLAGAHLVIVDTPIVAYCPHCATEREIPSAQMLCCPECGVATPNVITGAELELFAMELDEDVATHR